MPVLQDANLVAERVVVAANEPAPLDGVPHHRSAGSALLRRAPRGIPLHVATHETVGLVTTPAPYVEPHAHPAEELNVLVGAPGALRYRIQLGAESFEVASPAVVRLPAGVPHAATVVGGTGTYVCVILASTEDAFSGRASVATEPSAVLVHDLAGGELASSDEAVVVLVPEPGAAASVVLDVDDRSTVVDAPATLHLAEGVRWRLALDGAAVTAVCIRPSQR